MFGTGLPATVLEENWRARRPEGTAAALAIGTVNPATCVRQDEYVDWFFRVTKSDHLLELKTKMKRICEKSSVKKRHFSYTEEIISGHPGFIDRGLPSLEARVSITADLVPELGAAAARKAIREWGRPATDITHLIVSTNCGSYTPGPDIRIAGLLGLRPTVHRTLLYLHGCFGGSSALRFAKDHAENNRGARVLVVCSEVCTMLAFGAPDVAKMDALVVMSLFADGAGAVVVGAGPMEPEERPIFTMVSATQATVPGSDRALTMQLGESGIQFGMSAEVPRHVRQSIEQCLEDTLAPLGLAGGSSDRGWNRFFWVVHPGGRAILDSCETTLLLDPGKLSASRHVLSEYGNMASATIIFVLDEMRRRRQNGDETERSTCDNQWGVMLGIGPGITIETMVLQAASCTDKDTM